MNRDDLREEILSVNYYLTQAIIASNIEDIDRLRTQLNELIIKYKNLL